MKDTISILAYGDSNTWGYNPHSGTRFPPEIRWPKVLENCLEGRAAVTEEGLNGRTCLSFLPGSVPVNGSAYFFAKAEKYYPADIIIIFLGINDLFQEEQPSVNEIARGAGYLAEDAMERTASERFPQPVILLPPLPVNPRTEDSSLYLSLIEKSKMFSAAYKQTAQQCGCRYIDISLIIEASPLDGVHIDADEHITLGMHICDFIKRTFSGK